MSATDYGRGIELFNAQHFFDAHEIWEDVWRETTGPEKKFLQGLIQVAVAFHHHSTGNLAGARSLLARAHKNLSVYPGEYRGIRLADLLISVAKWQESLAAGRATPALPVLEQI